MYIDKSWQDYVGIHSGLEGARAAFEIDCALLLRSMYPGKAIQIVRANPGDEGIDIYIGNIYSGPIEVIQCKFFIETLGASQKNQIRDSFKRAVESTSFTMSKWHLWMPIAEFDIKESTWWDEWKAKQELAYKIPIGIAKGEELKANLVTHNLYNSVFKIEDSLKIEEIKSGIQFIISKLYPKQEITKVIENERFISSQEFSNLFALNYHKLYEEFYVEREHDALFNSSLLSPKNIWIHGGSGVGKTIACKRNLVARNVKFTYIYLNAGTEAKSADELLQLIYDNIYSRFEEDIKQVSNIGSISKRIVSLLNNIASQNKHIICIDEFPLANAKVLSEVSLCISAICADYSNLSNNNVLKFIISTIGNPNSFHSEKIKASEYFSFVEIADWQHEELAALMSKIENKLGSVLSPIQALKVLKEANTPRAVKSFLYTYIMQRQNQSFDKILEETLLKN